MLSAAALGGAVVGAMGTSAFADGHDPSLLLKEPHVCCGLNTCKGHGACKTDKHACKGKNECAGQGRCATAKHHACGGHNDCAGQGGCGAHPGQNAKCKGSGECAVPLNKQAWAKARAAFETVYEAKHGKKPGPAPASCGKG